MVEYINEKFGEDPFWIVYLMIAVWAVLEILTRL